MKWTSYGCISCCFYFNPSDLHLATYSTMSLLIHTQEFSEYFRNVSQFLQEFSWIYKTPVTNLLTQDVFSKIPNEWKGHILDLSIEELNEVPLGFIKVSLCSFLVYFCEEETINPQRYCFLYFSIKVFLHARLWKPKLKLCRPKLHLQFIADKTLDRCQLKLICVIKLSANLSL